MKTRLVVIAFAVLSGTFTSLLKKKASTFIDNMCLSRTTYASIGGFHRVNIVTFTEIYVFWIFTLSFFVTESVMILLFLALDALIGNYCIHVVFMVVTSFYEFVKLYVAPTYVLVLVYRSVPHMLANYQVKKTDFLFKFPTQMMSHNTAERRHKEEI